MAPCSFARHVDPQPVVGAVLRAAHGLPARLDHLREAPGQPGLTPSAAQPSQRQRGRCGGRRCSAAWVPSSQLRLRGRAGALGRDRQVVYYSTNLRTTPYELRMRKCGHRAITPGGRALSASCAVMGHKQQASTKGGPPARRRHVPSSATTKLRRDAALEASQPRGELTTKRCLRRILTTGMSFAVPESC